MPFWKNGVNPFVEVTQERGLGCNRKGAVMRKFMHSLMIATVSLGLTAGVAHGQGGRAAQKDELDSRALTVNALAEKRGGMKEAVHTVSVETGVPMEQLQSC